MSDEGNMTQEAMDGSRCVVELGAAEGYAVSDRRDRDYGFIRFQCGPVADNGENGTTIEKVIDVLIERLVGFQAGPFACRENAEAVSYLQAALNVLGERTARRVEQGVEGTNAAHAS